MCSDGLTAVLCAPICLQLSEEQLGMYIDLGHFANHSYYVVQEDTALSKVYTLFRTLALRHVCVVPRCDCGAVGNNSGS